MQSIKLHGFRSFSESTVGSMSWGTAKLEGGGSVDYLEYLETQGAAAGLRLIIDRRVLDEAAP